MSPISLLPLYIQAFAPPFVPPLTLFEVTVVPLTLGLLNPAISSQPSSYLASQQLVTVDLLPEVFFFTWIPGASLALGSFLPSFLHWAPSSVPFLSALPSSLSDLTHLRL